MTQVLCSPCILTVDKIKFFLFQRIFFCEVNPTLAVISVKILLFYMEKIQKIGHFVFERLQSSVWLGYGYVVTIFIYLRYMFLSGVSIVMVLVLVAEIFQFEKKIWCQKFPHTVNFLYFFWSGFLRNLTTFFTKNFLKK